MFKVFNNINRTQLVINKDQLKSLLKQFKQKGFKKQYVPNLNRKAYILNTVSDFKSFSVFKI